MSGRLSPALSYRPWILLFSVSLAGFGVNTGTFTSLGVVLPHMVHELKWSWTLAGGGFTILGAAVGLSSYFPRVLIRRFGVRATLIAGAACMALGFLCLSAVNGIGLFYLGTALCGVGYQMMSIIPATYVISAAFKRRALPLGIYFTAFALGGVCGPFISLGILHLVHDQWRYVWRVHVADVLVWGLVCATMIGSAARLAEDTRRAESQPDPQTTPMLNLTIYRTKTDWVFRNAVRTPQFWILAAAYMTHMLVAISVSSLSVPHLTQRGVPAATAAAMLSLEQLTQTGARIVGGVLGDVIDPLYLLIAGLFCLTLGPFALTYASTYPVMLVYALATGVGYGLTVFSSVILLMNYFGRTHNLEIFTFVSFSGAVAALGPTIGGVLRDATGNFQTSFLIFAGVNLLILIAVATMRPPRSAREAPVHAQDISDAEAVLAAGID
jgi:MFS family permease